MGAMLHNPEYDKYFFDCRNDQRIWLDFENMIVNPDIGRENWPQYVLQKEGQKNNP